MSSLKEQIVREVIDILQRSPEGRAIDFGALSAFLEEEALGWMYGSTLHTEPLYQYIQHATGWTEQQFVHALAPLEAKLASYHVDLEFSYPPAEETERTMIQSSPFGSAAAMAAALVTGGFAPKDHQGFSPEEKSALIELIIKCSGQTEVEKIIDPDKLRGFLEEAIDEMYEEGDCDLQMLWEILLDAPGVSEDMLIPAFLLMELEPSPIKLRLPSLVQKLPARMKQSMLAPFGVAPAGGVVVSSSLSAGPSSSSPDDRKYTPPRSSGPMSQSAPPARRSGERPAPAARRSGERPSPSRTAKASKSKKAPKTSRSTIQSAVKGKGGKTKAKKARGEESQGVLKLLLIVAAVVTLLAGAYYFFVLRTVPPTYEGTVISVPTKVFPAAEARLNKKHLLVRVKASFLSLPESKRIEKAHAFWELMRQKHIIHSLTLFDEQGKVIQTFDSR